MLPVCLQYLLKYPFLHLICYRAVDGANLLCISICLACACRVSCTCDCSELFCLFSRAVTAVSIPGATVRKVFVSCTFQPVSPFSLSNSLQFLCLPILCFIGIHGTHLRCLSVCFASVSRRLKAVNLCGNCAELGDNNRGDCTPERLWEQL